MQLDVKSHAQRRFKWIIVRIGLGKKRIITKYAAIAELSYMSLILRLMTCMRNLKLQPKKISKKAIEESPNSKAGYTKNISKAILKRKSFIANELRKIKE